MNVPAPDHLSVSVVVPTYNRAGQLPGALSSILAQTLAASEIFVVDDGSEDDTPEVISATPGPIRYIRQANEGVASARNRGMHEATGDLIAFLDSDDRWEPNKLAIQETLFRQRPDVGWSATELTVVDEAGSAIPGRRGLGGAVPVFRETSLRPAEWMSPRLDDVRMIADAQTFRALVGDAFGLLLNGNFIFPSTLVVRKSVADAVGPFDESLRMVEDMEYGFRLAVSARFGFVDVPLTRYRKGGADSLTHSGRAVELTQLGLTALDRAEGLRSPLSPFEQSSLRNGRRTIFLDQAYAHLSNLDRQACRSTLNRLRKTQGSLGVRGSRLLAASHFPVGVLRLAHAVKIHLGR